MAELIDLRPIWLQRAERGLSTPLYEEKLAIWSELSIPQANIFKKTGGYVPFKLMGRAHAHPARTVLVTGGIRASKSIGIGAEIAAWSRHSDLIWLAADSYELTRQEFEYAAEALISLEWVEPNAVSIPRDQYHPCSMETIWGTLIQCRSLHDVNTFVAKAPDAIFVCEPGLARPEVVVKARERLSTRRGLLWMAGTFEEARFNWMEEYWHRWARYPNAENAKSFVVPTWANTVLYPGGRHDPEIHLLENSMSHQDGLFMLRCAGIPVPPPNLVMRDTYNPRKHLQPWYFRATHDDGTIWPVHIAVDPGYDSGSHYVVTAYQLDEQEDGTNMIRVFEVIATQKQVHEEVFALCQSRPWWRNVASPSIIDPYAGDSHPYANVSVTQVWWDKLKIQLHSPPRVRVEEGLAFLKALMSQPGTGKTGITFDPEGTKHLQHELTHWRRRPIDGDYGRPSNRNCDAIKTLMYLSTHLYSQMSLSEYSLAPVVSNYSFSRR